MQWNMAHCVMYLYLCLSVFFLLNLYLYTHTSVCMSRIIYTKPIQMNALESRRRSPSDSMNAPESRRRSPITKRPISLIASTPMLSGGGPGDT